MAEEATGAVKHIVVAKFRDDVPPQRIDEVIKAYANLVSLIQPIKSLHWGMNLNKYNTHQGFTHVFESTFDTLEDIDVYMKHPAHVELSKNFRAVAEKFMVCDYEPSQLVVSNQLNGKDNY